MAGLTNERTGTHLGRHPVEHTVTGETTHQRCDSVSDQLANVTTVQIVYATSVDDAKAERMSRESEESTDTLTPNPDLTSRESLPIPDQRGHLSRESSAHVPSVPIHNSVTTLAVYPGHLPWVRTQCACTTNGWEHMMGQDMILASTKHVGAAWGEEHDAQCEICEEEPVAWLRRYTLGEGGPAIIEGRCEACHPRLT